MWLWFRIWTKILANQRIWRIDTDRRICIPLFTPSSTFVSGSQNLKIESARSHEASNGHKVALRYNGTGKNVRYSGVFVIAKTPLYRISLVKNKNIHYSGVTKLNNGIYTTHNSLQTCVWTATFKYSKALKDKVSLSWKNRSCVWLVNHLYYQVIFIDCKQQDKIFVIAG